MTNSSTMRNALSLHDMKYPLPPLPISPSNCVFVLVWQVWMLMRVLQVPALTLQAGLCVIHDATIVLPIACHTYSCKTKINSRYPGHKISLKRPRQKVKNHLQERLTLKSKYFVPFIKVCVRTVIISKATIGEGLSLACAISKADLNGCLHNYRQG